MINKHDFYFGTYLICTFLTYLLSRSYHLVGELDEFFLVLSFVFGILTLYHGIIRFMRSKDK